MHGPLNVKYVFERKNGQVMLTYTFTSDRSDNRIGFNPEVVIRGTVMWVPHFKNAKLAKTDRSRRNR